MDTDRSYKIVSEHTGSLGGLYTIPGGVAQKFDDYPVSRDIFVGKYNDVNLYFYICGGAMEYFVGYARGGHGVIWKGLSPEEARSESINRSLMTDVALARARSLGMVKMEESDGQ